MPHFHSLDVFDVTTIKIRFSKNTNCYSFELCGSKDEVTRINVWRSAVNNSIRPKLIVEPDEKEADFLGVTFPGQDTEEEADI